MSPARFKGRGEIKWLRHQCLAANLRERPWADVQLRHHFVGVIELFRVDDDASIIINAKRYMLGVKSAFDHDQVVGGKRVFRPKKPAIDVDRAGGAVNQGGQTRERANTEGPKPRRRRGPRGEPPLHPPKRTSKASERRGQG